MPLTDMFSIFILFKVATALGLIPVMKPIQDQDFGRD